MERLTQKADGGYVLDGPSEDAVNRLGLFEDFFEDLVREQEKYSGQLEDLRAKGKKNSAQFKELLGKKLMGSNTLLMLKMRGLE